MGHLNKKSLIFLLLSICVNALAVPADWNGSLMFDTNIIKDFRRTSDNCTDSKGECIKAEENNARFQSMILRLNPNIIVNDGVTIKSELSTGSVRTSNLGAATSTEGPNPNQGSGGSYFAQTTSSTLNVNQLYAELYADTARYRVGRFAKHYGLGAVINSGENANDRFFTGYEGIEASMKLGNFHLTPVWAKLHTANEAAENPNGKYDAYETSVTAMYDNPNRNLKFGVFYGQREVETNNDLFGNNSGPHNVTIIDVFIAKSWENFGFELEIPMISGEVGNTYGTTDADLDSNAYILETTYTANSKWKLGVNAGIVKGDDGETNSFEGMYLHPNYQIAEIMYRYNYRGFNDADNYDVYNSSIVNSQYAQLFAHYEKGEWRWKMSFLWAKANEVAETGKTYYNHSRKATAVATQDQSDDLGYEFDISFEYQWNPSVVYSGFLGYHMVGDYYKFSDDTEELETTNVMASGMRLSVNF